MVVLRSASVPTVMEAPRLRQWLKTGNWGHRGDHESGEGMSEERWAEAVEAKATLAVDAGVAESASSKVRPEVVEVGDSTTAEALGVDVRPAILGAAHRKCIVSAVREILVEASLDRSSMLAEAQEGCRTSGEDQHTRSGRRMCYEPELRRDVGSTSDAAMLLEASDPSAKTAREAQAEAEADQAASVRAGRGDGNGYCVDLVAGACKEMAVEGTAGAAVEARRPM